MQQNSKIYIELDRDEVITKAIDLMAQATDGSIVKKGFWSESCKAKPVLISKAIGQRIV